MYQSQGEPMDLHNKIERLEAELARLRAQLAASESKRALLATECKAGRLWNDRCRCGGECECIPGKKLHKARVATDAACALEGE